MGGASAYYRSAAPRGAQLSSGHQQEILGEFISASVGRGRLSLVADIGSGRGSNLGTLGRWADTVVTVDVSVDALREGRAQWVGPPGTVAPVLASATQLPFRPEAFPLTVCTEVLEHVPALSEAASELERVTARGGHLVVSAPNYRNVMGVVKLWRDWRSGRHDFDPWDAHRGGYEGFMTAPRLRRGFRSSRLVRHRGADYAFALGIRWGPVRRRVNRHLLLRPGYGRLAPWGMQYYMLLERS